MFDPADKIQRKIVVRDRVNTKKITSWFRIFWDSSCSCPLKNLIFTGLEVSPDANSWASVAYGLFYWMFGGLGQEVLFRGLILFSLQRWKGWKIALVVSSVLFGLMHVRQGVTGGMGTILIGGYWGWVALKTRNIIGTSIAHGFYNFIFTFLFVS